MHRMNKIQNCCYCSSG